MVATGLMDTLKLFAEEQKNGYELLSNVYICLTLGHLELLELREVTYTMKNTSKPLECQLITSIGLSTCYERIRAMLALESERKGKVLRLVYGS
jgi:hypothetical protein